MANWEIFGLLFVPAVAVVAVVAIYHRVPRQRPLDRTKPAREKRGMTQQSGHRRDSWYVTGYHETVYLHFHCRAIIALDHHPNVFKGL
jgi:hypothetical protein